MVSAVTARLVLGALGMPPRSAIYYVREPEDRTKEYELRVKDVPCNAMWSITIYDAKGYFPSEKGISSNIILSRGKRTPTRLAFANLWHGREHFVQRLYFYMFRSL